MAKTQPFQHKIHKYFRKKVGDKRRVIYACAVPGCTHYLEPAMVKNKMSICWNCEQPFIMPDKLQLINSKPWCEDCKEGRKKKKPDEAITKLLSEIIK
jgi:hypothetical protein